MSLRVASSSWQSVVFPPPDGAEMTKRRGEVEGMTKIQIPNSKSQRSSKLQIPNSKSQTFHVPDLKFGILSFGIYLGFGFWVLEFSFNVHCLLTKLLQLRLQHHH